MTGLAKSTGKKAGKENVPAKTVREDSFDDMMDKEDAEPRKAAALTKSTSSKTSKSSRQPAEAGNDAGSSDAGPSKGGRGTAELERRLAAMTAERDRCKTQRDNFAAQFEELSRLRNTEAEALIEKHKERADTRAKTQDSIIAKQTTAMETQQKKILDLEARLEKALAMPHAGGPFEAPSKSKADAKELKILREELAGAKSTIDSKNKKVAELQKQVDDEVKYSRQLQAQSKGAGGASSGSASEESAKDAASLRLYEDMTDLNIVNVTITHDPRSGKETTFNCIQTHSAKSHNFKLKSHNVLDQAKAKAKHPNPWTKMVLYTPGNLDNETEEFRAQLGTFAHEFTVPRDQLLSLVENLKAAMAGDD